MTKTLATMVLFVFKHLYPAFPGLILLSAYLFVVDPLKQLKGQNVPRTTINILLKMRAERHKLAHEFKYEKLRNRQEFVQNFQTVIRSFQTATTFDQSDSDYVEEIISRAN